MKEQALLRAVDAIMLAVPDLDQGLRFYRDQLNHELVWRNDALGQAGLRLPDGDTELVLSTELGSAVNWLVASVTHAVDSIVAAGGTIVAEPTDIPVGTVAVVADPFGNELVLLELSNGRYSTDATRHVTGVRRSDTDRSNTDR